MNAKKLLVALSAGFVCLGGATSANAAKILVNDVATANVDITLVAPAAVSHSLTQKGGVEMLTSSLGADVLVAEGQVKSANGPTLMAVSVDNRNVVDNPQCSDLKMNTDNNSKLRVCLVESTVQHQDGANRPWYQLGNGAQDVASYSIELAGGQDWRAVKPGIYNLSMSAAAFVM